MSEVIKSGISVPVCELDYWSLRFNSLVSLSSCHKTKNECTSFSVWKQNMHVVVWMDVRQHSQLKISESIKIHKRDYLLEVVVISFVIN